MKHAVILTLYALIVTHCAISTSVNANTEKNGPICETTKDCPEKLFCRSEQCVEPKTLPSKQCPDFKAGVRTPTIVETNYEHVAGIEHTRPPFLFEGKHIYWFDEGNALHAQQRDVGDSHQVLRPATDNVYIGALVADDRNLYWSESKPQPASDIDTEMGLPYVPPGQIYSVSKQGGEVVRLLYDADRVLSPVAFVEDRLVLRSIGQYFTVAKDGTGLAAINFDERADIVRLLDNDVYLLYDSPTDTDDDDSYDLWRSDFRGAEPDLITRVENYLFLVRDGRVLWIQERTRTDPLVLEQNFVMFDEATGCVSTLPGDGQSISFDAIMDDHHVYWFSYNALAAVSISTDGSGTVVASDPPEMPLVRLDLSTGAIEQIATAGFTVLLGGHIVGQTDDTLYIQYDGELTAIDKSR